jgi:predicted anti-sigma-YlaC factor YlaD
MTDCANAEVRDALPDMLHGRLDAAARARVEEHLAGCEECRRELQLLQSLRKAAPQPAVDVARIVAALPSPHRRSAWTAHVWQIAAAVVFIAVGSSTVVTYLHRERRPDSAATATVATAAGSAMGGSTTAAHSGDVELAVGYGYTDLTDAQLEALLKDVQNLKAVPMEDPDVSMPDVTIGNGGV